MAARPDALIPHAPSERPPPVACGSASEHPQAIDDDGSAASVDAGNAGSGDPGGAASVREGGDARRRSTRQHVARDRERRRAGREHAARRRHAILWTMKALLWIACLVPFGLLVWWGAHDQLTANPIERITRWTGRWTLALLLATLAITPIRRLTGWNHVIRVRRLIGLFAFFYGVLHFLTYLVVDQFFAWGFIAEDILERPYITVGFTGFVLLIPLAATSTKGMIRRLGGKRWQRLHRLVYVTAILGVLHFLWAVKADTRDPLMFGAVLLVLLTLRLRWTRRRDSIRRQGNRSRA